MAWKREEIEDNREGVAIFTARIEVNLGGGNQKQTSAPGEMPE